MYCFSSGFDATSGMNNRVQKKRSIMSTRLKTIRNWSSALCMVSICEIQAEPIQNRTVSDNRASVSITGAVVERDVHAFLDRLEAMNIDNITNLAETIYGTNVTALCKVGGQKVLLEGMGIQKTVVSNPDGSFRFDNLPPGRYIMHTVKPDMPTGIRGICRTATARTEIARFSGTRRVCLQLRNDLITMKGRVVDEQGKGLPYASVLIWPEGAETSEFERRTVTDNEGRYEISDIVPADWLKVAWYLTAEKSSRVPGAFEMSVNRHGYANPKEPLVVVFVTDEQLEPARRVNKIANGILKHTMGKDLPERKILPFPKSEGNVIFVSDIMLKKE